MIHQDIDGWDKTTFSYWPFRNNFWLFYKMKFWHDRIPCNFHEMYIFKITIRLLHIYVLVFFSTYANMSCCAFETFFRILFHTKVLLRHWTSNITQDKHLVSCKSVYSAGLELVPSFFKKQCCFNRFEM